MIEENHVVPVQDIGNEEDGDPNKDDLAKGIIQLRKSL